MQPEVKKIVKAYPKSIAYFRNYRKVANVAGLPRDRYSGASPK